MYECALGVVLRKGGGGVRVCSEGGGGWLRAGTRAVLLHAVLPWVFPLPSFHTERLCSC